MDETGFSPHTIKAFSGDLRLLQNYFGPQVPIYELGTQELNQFLYWLQYERGVPCSPKSYARRVTTLKSFFGWLTSINVTPFDPAAAVVHQRITTPLPTILQNDEIDRLLEVTEGMANALKPDPRPHLLVNLLLQTGIKKAECMRLTPDDFEDFEPEHPTVLIRYQEPRLLHKERRLDVSPELMATLDQYLELYKPDERIFECTPRNLEYVLTDAAEQARLPNGASFESLRWTSAFRDFRDGMPHSKLQEKMGLSKVTFRETLKKLEKLASAQE
jgi:integrase/recombinase XerD